MAVQRPLALGPARLRAVAAVLALATVAIGALADPEVQLAVLTVMLAGMLMVERQQKLAGPEAASMNVPLQGL